MDMEWLGDDYGREEAEEMAKPARWYAIYLNVTVLPLTV